MRKVSILIFMMGLVGLVTSCCTKTDSATVVDEKQVVVDNMLGRRSIRAYKETPVPKEIMDVILNCGINAPNGMNKQPWEIRVVSNEEYLKGISDLQKENMDPNSPHNPFNEPGFRNIFRNAPTVVFIATDSGMCSQVDCGLLAGNMVNTAWAYGIGSCIQMGPIRFMKRMWLNLMLINLDSLTDMNCLWLLDSAIQMSLRMPNQEIILKYNIFLKIENSE